MGTFLWPLQTPLNPLKYQLYQLYNLTLICSHNSVFIVWPLGGAIDTIKLYSCYFCFLLLIDWLCSFISLFTCLLVCFFCLLVSVFSASLDYCYPLELAEGGVALFWLGLYSIFYLGLIVSYNMFKFSNSKNSQTHKIYTIHAI